MSLGAGDGTFPNGTWLFTENAHLEFAVADFEGDGDLDIASNSAEEGTTLLNNDGTGSFSSSVLAGEYVHGYRNAVGIAAGDVDGDTIPDVVVAHVTGSDVGVHAGFGDGKFEARQVRYGLRPQVTDIGLADLNGDGLLDIVSPATVGSGGRTPDDSDTADDTEAAGATGADSMLPPGSGVLVLANNRAKCTIVGTTGPDTLRGTQKTDVICGLGGDDVIKGLGGGDILRGGTGADRLTGGDGIDVLDGERGDDLVDGNGHNDKLRGGAGADTLRGGAGADVIDVLDGTVGNDSGGGGKARDHCRGDAEDVTSC